MKTLSVANQKGGVGKSTLTVHLAYAALERGHRVLLVDMDRQGSLSLSFPPAPPGVTGLPASSLYAAIPPEGEPETLTEYLSIVRADPALLSVDKAENDAIRRPGVVLRGPLGRGFDLCLIDTPPLLGVRLMGALAASDYVITPVSIGLYELAGVADLMATIQVIRTQGFNPRLTHLGILPMKTNTRSGDQTAALDQLRARHGGAILPQSLPERAPVRRAIMERVPVWRSPRGDNHLRAAQEWRGACNAILNKIGF